MKYFEFLEAFAKVAHEFEVRDNKLRTGEGNLECPITRVCRELTSQWYDLYLVDSAAIDIGLDFALAQEIADTSDDRHDNEPDYMPTFSARTRRDLTELIEKAKKIRGTKGK